MDLNWIAVAAEAAQKLLSIQTAMLNREPGQPLPLDIAMGVVQDDDQNAMGYLLWNSPRTGGQWGQMVSLQLSLCGDVIRVVGDDFQPWGCDGKDCSHVFACVSTRDMSRAAQILCRVARQGFALDTVHENETDGRYERGSPELPDLSEESPTAYERQRA